MTATIQLLMSVEELPYRAKPELLHEICRLIRMRSGITKSEVYSNIDENQKTLRRTLLYGVELGFLEQDGERFELTSRGSGISYSSSFEGQEAIIEGFREAIEDYGPYRDAFIRIYEGGLESTVNNSRVIGQDTFREQLEKSVEGEVEDREVNVLIKTAEAAELGQYKPGRRGYQTRLILDDDSYEEFASELAETYPLPADEDIQHDEEQIEEESEIKDGKVEDYQNTDKIQPTGRLSLTVELDVNDKSEEEIARIIRRIRNAPDEI